MHIYIYIPAFAMYMYIYTIHIPSNPIENNIPLKWLQTTFLYVLLRFTVYVRFVDYIPIIYPKRHNNHRLVPFCVFFPRYIKYIYIQ